ncbi:unnamed protein product [Orchesella dallaii]|uniref:RGS domain-containing protein n=1 Tax=Orchesella dallaii TaxID=48710 RepID=A0ABP1RYD9_9HEXA
MDKEEKTGGGSSGSSISVPLYPWLSNLESTLNSTEGTKALESYLVRSDSLSLLEFIWACDGMKSLVQENPEKTDQLVSCIYKNYIMSGSLPCLSNGVVITIAQLLESHFERPDPSDCSKTFMKMKTESRSACIDVNIFDQAKTEVEAHLRSQVFPLFVKAVGNGSVYVGGRAGSGTSTSTASTLASHPEAFARALCEKLEGLQMTRKKDEK